MTRGMLRYSQLGVEIGGGECKWAEEKGVFRAKREFYPRTQT